MTWAEWGEKVRVWVNAGDLPDVCFWDYNAADMINYVDQGLLKQFPEGFAETYPNIENALQASAIAYPLAGIVGGVYALPRVIVFNPPVSTSAYTNVWAFKVRMDWITQLGYEKKDNYTISEFVSIMQAIVANYDQLGLQKGVDFVWSNDYGDLWWSLFDCWEGRTEIYYDEASDKYVWGCDKDYDQILEALTLYRQGVDEGWIHPDYYSFTENNECRDFLKSGHGFTSFMECLFGEGVPDFIEQTGLNYYEHIAVVCVTADNGCLYEEVALNFWAGELFNPSMDDAKFARILDMIDWTLSEEGACTKFMGIQGIDWDYDADGKLVWMHTKDAATGKIIAEDGTLYSLSDIYPSTVLLSNIGICGDDFNYWDPGLTEQEVTDRMQLWENKKVSIEANNCAFQYDWDYRLYSSDLKNKFGSAYNFGAKAAEWVSSGADLKTQFDQFISDQRALVDEVLADINANVVHGTING